MIRGVGVDIISVERVFRWIERYDHATLGLIFTIGELERCGSSDQPAKCFSMCFATKEAVAKALGTNMYGISWNQIDVELKAWSPRIILKGKALSASHNRK